MRGSCAFVVCLSASAAICGCVQLPALGFSVRSTWRTHPEHDGRSVELITGVLLGWSGRNGTLAPLDVAADELTAEQEEAVLEHDLDPATPPLAFADDALPCTDAELCRWELDERNAALERSGTRSEQESP
jgi:hypothetical protein